MSSSKLGKASITVRCTAEQKKAIEKKWKSLGLTQKHSIFGL